MRQVRLGVFETNSSSTHSLCITKEVVEPSTKSIDFRFGEFGWEFDEYNTTQEKASYLYTGIYENGLEVFIDQIKKYLNSDNIYYTFEEPKYYTSNNCKFFDSGFVDHGGELISFIKDVCSNKEKLYSYLFSNDSFVLTGNDNSEREVDIRVNYPHYEYYKGN